MDALPAGEEYIFKSIWSRNRKKKGICHAIKFFDNPFSGYFSKKRFVIDIGLYIFEENVNSNKFLGIA
jgi:hypothetical protein